MDATGWSRGLAVEVGGRDVVSHVGTAAVRLLADRVGVTGALSKALAGTRQFPLHDRGRVFTDIAVGIADGSTRIKDIATLADQGELFGAVASVPTAWRVLKEVDAERLTAVTAARAAARVGVWEQIVARHGRIPPCTVAGRDLGDMIVIRLDASLVLAHSDKEKAARTFKKTFGHHPMMAWCDNTGGLLAIKLRPGNAGANTAADNIEVLDAAIGQLPAGYRKKILVTVDGAGASHDLVDHIAELNEDPDRQVYYAVGFDLDERGRQAIGKVPGRVWAPAVDAEGEPRDNGEVAELTGLYRTGRARDQLKDWPKDMRIIARWERSHPGAQLSLFEQHEGFRFQLTATSLPDRNIQLVEACHRVQARVESRIRCGKATGLRRMPSKSFAVNSAWCAAVALACDLLAWLALLALDGELAKAEPKTVRYRLLHTAGRIIRGQRQRRLRLPENWPWVDALRTAFMRIFALPAPT
ncbi:IS1380 family transposase [Frankia sp. Cppng1_Ct_nod]|uniref:IS1380 family transposase n=1 Tax=Frankia sp. Cppng1_Ct_nod TaxID=2897162 RepID=UPI0010417A96|nr:IS1380 family transposase [Frankia sp. Cppng1_Ct_nod]